MAALTPPPLSDASESGDTRGALLRYFAVGLLFGIVLTKGEVVSWYRIQEMFRFRAFHMYGTIMTAILMAGASVELLRRGGVRALDGSPIALSPKAMGKGHRYILGGTIFGLGWALTGACPGPLFALVGSGVGVMAVPLLSALAGTWAYGWLSPRLPH